MSRPAKTFVRIMLAACAILGLLLAIVLLVFWSSLGRDFRVSFVSDALSDMLGYQVVIEGDAYLGLSPNLSVVVTDLRLPAVDFEDVDLAVLEQARLVLAPTATLRGGVPIPEIEASGLTVSLLRDENGQTTWIDAPTSPSLETADSTAPSVDWTVFLGRRNILFADMKVSVENALTGFVFDFQLEEFTVDQLTDELVDTADVVFDGTMNGQPVEFSSAFSDGEPFYATGRIGELDFELTGEQVPDRPPGDFDGELQFATDDLDNLLKVLRLDGQVGGAGHGSVSVARRAGHIDLTDMNLNTTFENGQKARLTGDLSDRRFGADFDVIFIYDFVGANQRRPPAVFVKDIRPERVEMRIMSQDGNIEVERLKLDTNAFDEEFREIGPFSVEKVSRQADGALKLEGVTFLIGPPEAPFVYAHGSVDNILKLEGYSIEGDLDLPAQQVLLTLREENAEKFGRLLGTLRLSEVDGKPFLEDLELRSDQTELWEGYLQLQTSNVMDFDGIELNATIGTANGRELLDALQLKPIETGALRYEIRAQRSGSEINVDTDITANDTSFNNSGALQIRDGAPYIRGSISSQSVKISDMRQAYSALQELARVPKLHADLIKAEKSAEDEEFQPLVLEEDTAETSENLEDFQPLVVDEAPSRLDQQEDLSGFQPLVISQDLSDVPIKDLMDPEKLLREVDLKVALDLQKIIGQKGLSRIDSDVVLQNGTLRFGPVPLGFGSGKASVGAAINLIDTPERVSVTGNTSAVDLGELLSAAGVDIQASGGVSARFDISGIYANAPSFLNSMQGSATVDMQQGRVSTALIELAGLGVVPWLFSSERRQGGTEIVCLKAPLQIRGGRVTTSQTVLETRRVQLVASGTIDLKNKTIDMTAQPRAVGRPLSRSPWPFKVTGSLTEPQISVAQRKTRRATVPLAMPEQRRPCVPDVSQLAPTTEGQKHARPR